ncbi:MAG TPA: hypothetical protein VFZ59_07725 [Verrucomicrobiae bacterium]|nr:hypothetical protein [Verrucomicrobiae bacterium]
MKLHSPAFARQLRRTVRMAIRRSPELKREARRTHRARHYSARPLFRLGISGLAAWLTWIIASRTGHLNSALVFIGIWLFGWISILVQSLAHQLYLSPDLAAFSLLPIEGRVVLRRQIEKFLRGATWLLMDSLAMLGTLAWFAEIPFPQWIAILPIAVFAWLSTLALVSLAMVYLPWLPYPLLTTAGTFALFVLFVAHSLVGPALLAGLDASAGTLRLLLPTAWPVFLFRLLLPNPSWFELLFLLPSAALVVTLRQTYSRVAGGYEFSEAIQDESSDILPEEETSIATAHPDAPLRVGLTAIEEVVQTRRFLAAVSWPKAGWLEARLWQWLNARERKLAEFAFPHSIEITKAWKKVFQHLAIGLAIGFALGWVNPTVSFWVMCAAMLLPALRVAACFYGNGRAFSPVFCSGVNIQLYAVYPIGYRDLSHVLFKYSFVQLPLVVGFLIVCGLVTAYLFRWQFPLGALLGFKTAFLLAALRLIFVALAFSSGTNDSTRL